MCSAHFRDEDFETDMYSKIMGEGHTSRRRLKKGAIPSQFLRGEKRSAAVSDISTDSKRRISSYVAQRETADAENELQCILNSSIDISTQECSTTDFSADVRPSMCDKKMQTKRHTSDAWIQCSSQTVTRSVCVQTDTHCDEVEFESSSTSSEQSTDDVFFPSDSEPNIDIVEDDDSTDENSVTTADRRKPRYFVVSMDSIETLLKFCPLCGSPVDSRLVIATLSAECYVFR